MCNLNIHEDFEKFFLLEIYIFTAFSFRFAVATCITLSWLTKSCLFKQERKNVIILNILKNNKKKKKTEFS